MKQAEKATNNNATRNKNKSAADVKNSKEYETLRDMARDFAAKDYENWKISNRISTACAATWCN